MKFNILFIKNNVQFYDKFTTQYNIIPSVSYNKLKYNTENVNLVKFYRWLNCKSHAVTNIFIYRVT